MPAAVLNRTTKQLFNSPPGTPADWPAVDWIIDPDLSGVVGVPSKYWNIVGDTVSEMNQAEKAAVDAAEAAAFTAANRTEAIDYTANVDGDGVRTRALIELLNKRDNYLVNRVEELQNALIALQASGGDANARLDALPTSYLATNTRTKADAVQEYVNDINAGNQDT